MSRNPSPLPADLAGRVFTTEEAFSCGVSSERLRRRDLRPLVKGVYAPEGHSLTEREVVGALCRKYPGAAAAGLTAARLWGMPLPLSVGSWSLGTPVTLLSPRALHRHDRAIVHWQHRDLDRTRIVHGNECRATSMVQTWIDLRHDLSPSWLVVIGDHLVRKPRAWAEGRDAPYAAVEELVRAARAATGRGIVGLRGAAERVRVGSDSPQETLLRLACAEAGLPMPELNSPWIAGGEDLGTPDLLWRSHGVCVEYDGRTHLSPEQRWRDIRREMRRREQGMVEIRVVHEEARHGWSAPVARIAKALRERE